LGANPTIAAEPEGLVTALNYVIPQINRAPNVCGFSPIQWTLGFMPHIPGLLVESSTGNNPAHLDPSAWRSFAYNKKPRKPQLRLMVIAD
jgi:hypothetical protein